MIKISLKQIQPNFAQVSIGNLDLYFSYETVVAFSADGYRSVSENQWSVTTGKHLTQNFGKGGRVPATLFNAQLAETLEKVGVVQTKWEGPV